MNWYKAIAVYLFLGACSNCCAWEAKRVVLIHETDSGIQFGSWGKLPNEPAATLIVLSSTIEESLGNAYFRQAGNELGKQGYLLISIDLPCHGKQHRTGEPKGLAGWPFMCLNGDNFVDETNKRLSAILDYLIRRKHTDPQKIAVCGTSRGGYLALQFAAFSPRVKAVAAFAPVTDLAALREFRGIENNKMVQSLAISNQAEKLAGLPIWIVIGDRDQRVGTDHAISLARRITNASLAKINESNVELHVIAEPLGHTVPKGSAEQAAAWIAQQLKTDSSNSKDPE